MTRDVEGSAWLLGVMERYRASADASDLLAAAVSDVRAEAGASVAAVIVGSSDGPVLSHHGGIPVPGFAVDEGHGLTRSTEVAPASWQEAGVVSVLVQPLPGRLGALAFGWTEADLAAQRRLPIESLVVLVAHLLETLARIEAADALADLRRRVQGAQQLAGMGDYDWHIASDTNQWSDHLYRIYGHEPQSFNASYDRFLDSIHPDDRARIQAVHQDAYASGEPYATIERIVRPDGEVRYLSSNGEVIHDAHGAPVRMRGTCVDVTERILAEQERERVSALLHALVDQAPDAIVVADEHRQVIQANPRAVALLGADPVGHATAWLTTNEVSTGQGQRATGLDGRDLVLDVTEVQLTASDHRARTALYLVDAAPRLEQEALTQRLVESRQRRRQAFEINDNVVQGLTAASYALEQSSLDSVRVYLDRTIESARTMMDDLLDPAGEFLVAGDLVRSTAATLDVASEAVVTMASDTEMSARSPGTRPRVLIVDDYEDLRVLLRAQLGGLGTFDIVGEAVDGLDAVDKARLLQPDLVLLDISMPRMDGLQALPLIRAVAPDVRVVALSGFDHVTLEKEAIAAGAHRYVTKGGKARDLIAVITSVLDTS